MDGDLDHLTIPGYVNESDHFDDLDDLDESLDELFDALFEDDTLVELIAAFEYPRRVDNELSKYQELIENGEYKTAIVRQAAFIEYTIRADLINELESHKEGELSGSETDALERIGNKDLIYFANALGVFETENAYQAFSELMGARNSITHEWWEMFDDDDEERFERIAIRVTNNLDEVVSAE